MAGKQLIAKRERAPAAMVHNRATCEKWLASTPLADPRHAALEITALLEDLLEHPPEPSNCLDVLERLRETVLVTDAECAKRYAGRPTPLLDGETDTFEQSLDLWTTYCNVYRQLAVGARGNENTQFSRHLTLSLGARLMP
jgi:hypothetical protein